ncbi:MAG TPA: DUF2007 domain-containing protein [Longimicrobiales bacterium]|nr:DUF2007 domain-containing protein [Longimicrobiales bacterium]
MDTVMVAAYRYRHEGEFARARLESAGIPCVLTADDGGGMRPEIMSANPVRIYVTADRAEEAAAALADDDADAAEIDEAMDE